MTDLATAPTLQDLVDDSDDKEIEAMKQRVKEMEAEALRLRELQEEAEKSELAAAGGVPDMAALSGASGEGMDVEDEGRDSADGRSVYVGNVDYGATPEEIQAHFQSCGTINRVTIICDKFTGHPKGYAYVEFAEPTFVQNAMVLNDSLFRGRLIKVTEKRTNIPGFNSRGRPPRGGYRGGYRARGGGFGYQPYRARGRGRGRGF